MSVWSQKAMSQMSQVVGVYLVFCSGGWKLSSLSFTKGVQSDSTSCKNSHIILNNSLFSDANRIIYCTDNSLQVLLHTCPIITPLSQVA